MIAGFLNHQQYDIFISIGVITWYLPLRIHWLGALEIQPGFLGGPETHIQSHDSQAKSVFAEGSDAWQAYLRQTNMLWTMVCWYEELLSNIFHKTGLAGKSLNHMDHFWFVMVLFSKMAVGFSRTCLCYFVQKLIQMQNSSSKRIQNKGGPCWANRVIKLPVLSQ